MIQTAVRYPIISPTLPDMAEIQDQIQSIFASGRVTIGEQVAGLEADVRERTGARNCIAVSCGTSALMLLLRALRLPEGSEVITPSFTFAATSHALLWNGLRPVLCDSEPGSFTMDANAAKSSSRAEHPPFTPSASLAFPETWTRISGWPTGVASPFSLTPPRA